MRELALAAKEAGVNLDLPAWSFAGELETGFGYADNITLAPIDPEASTLARAAGNALAWRTLGDSTELAGIVDATYTRYFSASVDDATLLITRAEGRWQPEGAWRLSGAVQGIYQDEVVDTSSLENNLGSIRARLTTISALPTAECRVIRNWTLLIRPALRRFDYRAPLDDFTESELEGGLSRALGRAGSLALTARAMERDYDDRPQAGPVGRPIYGTRLSVRQIATDLRLDISGGRDASWSARVHAGVLQNRDNGSGYYDYDRWMVDVRSVVTRGPWTIEAEAGWSDSTYLVQFAGYGIDPEHRARTEWRGFVRVERSLGPAVSLFAEWDATDSDSNDLFIDYESVVVLAGARWNF